MEKKVEVKIHLKDYLYILKKRMWTVVLVFIFLLLTVTIATFKQVKIYRAVCQIMIEFSADRIVSFPDISQVSGYREYFETQFKIIKSRSAALEVINILFPGKNFTEDEKLSLADEIRERIKVNPIKGTNLVNLEVEGSDPNEITSLVNTISEVYMEKSLESKVNDYKTASGWLDDQITSVILKMKKAEFDLQKYRENKKIISPKIEDRQGSVMDELTLVNVERNQLKSKKVELEISLSQIKSMTEKGIDIDETTLPGFMKQTNLPGMRQKTYAIKEEIAKLEKTYMPKHPRVVRAKEELTALQENIKNEIRTIIESIQNDYELTKSKEGILNERRDELNEEAISLLERSIQYNILDREVEINRNLYDYLLKRAGEINVTGSMRFSNITLVDKATVPKVPVAPNKPRNILLGTLVGLILGCGLAFFLEYLDTTIRSIEDIEHYINIPLLGFVPSFSAYIKRREKRSNPELVSFTHPKSTVAECYRAIRTNLLFSSDHPPKVMMVTSSTPEEGKTITSVNLAITMAHSEKRVLLIDADLRKSRIHEIFKIENRFGFSTILTDSIDPLSVIIKTKIPYLSVLTSGPLPKNPSELLMSLRMRELINIFRNNYDFILLDSPPILPVTDPSIIARYSDVVCFVIRSGVTGKDVVIKNAKKFQELEVKRLGVILNDVSKQDSNYYYTEYYYSYYNRAEDLESQ
ncbi:MAG: hypothetical protein A2043_10825 [Candidatus Schekmanbacteria bacterium GWA2_38_9]|uniref:non-specific protein-tyrosine kinase n=1 Tax=Candidatus Schekmanbacteria bacterium RIFCSPLOWO2_12_FULL_38_15 TaxID=1817883 RepID=A0A1F7SHX0_9BACT|nr:MAG: hypothetical protein A2043_10825 [Candidatus Schekmanbacteria bacterium GWA2_38_9]OGL49350.1 MAG: hypothetical protein A3H37_06700 [Candidatus Schekmanbacteria bacterium RIFCSPLOWO2_02_FULL_38_14]OGL52828.1 MAG: hypothetical protein A3G31_00320 [Candidatus Schekmanbacteria bacterium RIFCSPLOWO2_12_FULL_38_15]